MEKTEIYGVSLAGLLAVLVIVNVFVNFGVMSVMMVSVVGLAALTFFFAWLFDG